MKILIHDSLFELGNDKYCTDAFEGLQQTGSLGDLLKQILAGRSTAFGEPLHVSKVTAAEILSSREGLRLVAWETWPADLEIPNSVLSATLILGHGQEFFLPAEKLLEMDCAAVVTGPVPLDFLIASVLHAFRRQERPSLENAVGRIEAECGKRFTEKEKTLLFHLIRCQSQGADRKDLTDSAWSALLGNQKTLDTHIFNLRRKLEKSHHEIIFKKGRWYLRQIQSAADVELSL